MAHREILVSAGAVEYVGGTVTESTGKDIGTAVFELALGSRTNPGTWVAPSTSQAGPLGPSQRVLKLLIDNTTPKGTYYCWARIQDTPETTTVRFPVQITVR